MAKTTKSKSAVPYARRLIEDKYVQEQIRSAASGLRGAYDRARKQGSQATDDKRLYGQLRQAAASIQRATTALQQPKPTPKRRVRKLVIFASAVGACVWLTMKLQNQHPTASQASDSATAMTATPEDNSQEPIAEPRESSTMTPPAA
jgi:ferric-dicitrate binding protein FerR (iron transport regulator)